MTYIIGHRERMCRGCGCTDSRACVTPGGPCAWVLLDVAAPTGVCSACAAELEWNPAALAMVGTEDDESGVLSGAVS